jgi:hypothetical protein
MGMGYELMSTWMGVAVDEEMSGEEVLRLFGRFEPLHLPLSSFASADASSRPDCSDIGFVGARRREAVDLERHHSLLSLSVTITRGTYCKPFRSRLKKRLAALASRRA